MRAAGTGPALDAAQDYAFFAWMAEGGLNNLGTGTGVQSNCRLQTEVNALPAVSQGHVDHACAAAVPLLHAVRMESRDLVAHRLAKALKSQYPTCRRNACWLRPTFH